MTYWISSSQLFKQLNYGDGNFTEAYYRQGWRYSTNSRALSVSNLTVPPSFFFKILQRSSNSVYDLVIAKMEGFIVVDLQRAFVVA